MSFETIKRGDRGERVADLQRQLAALGYLTDNEHHSDVTEEFDDSTVIALKMFQRDHHLKRTEFCDEKTWKVLGEEIDKLFEDSQ